MSTHGFDGGASDTRKNQVKSFTRFILLTLQETLPQACSGLKYGEVLRFLPDEGQHTSMLAGMTTDQVQAKIGTNAIMISCWTCLIEWASEQYGRKLLRLSEKDLRDVFDQHLLDYSLARLNDGDESVALMPYPATCLPDDAL